MKKWDQKCKDDSETANWLNANTKDCIAYPSPCRRVGSLSSSSPCTLAGPKCHTAIEKNGGCNHMVLPVRARCVISSSSHSLLTFRPFLPTKRKMWEVPVRLWEESPSLFGPARTHPRSTRNTQEHTTESERGRSRYLRVHVGLETMVVVKVTLQRLSGSARVLSVVQPRS